MQTKTLLTTLAACAALTATSAQAALVASYVNGTDADGDALTTELAGNSDVNAGALSAVGFSGGTLITRPSFVVDTPAGPTAGSSAGSEWLFARSRNSTGTTPTTPGFTDDYFGFTVSAANIGETLDLNTLKFDFVAVVDASGSIEGKAQAFINVDGGGFSSIGSEVIAAVTKTDTETHQFGAVTQASIDLSSITGASSIEIRIGLGDNRDEDGKATFVQGIQLDADVVPEPGSLALLGLGGLLIASRRRRG